MITKVPQIFIANPDTRGSLRETSRVPIKENPAYAR